MAIKQVSAHYFWLAFPKLRIFLLIFIIKIMKFISNLIFN